MATELLKRTVIRYFDEQDIKYTVSGNDVVQTTLPTPEGVVRFWIIDHEFPKPLLEIRAPDFVRFPSTEEVNATSMCNKLNGKSVGKFVIDDYRDVSYLLDCPVNENTTPDDFERLMLLAMSSFAKFYPIIMAVRWANATVEQAEQRQQGGEPGVPEMSGDEIMRLLRKDDSEEADSETEDR